VIETRWLTDPSAELPKEIASRTTTPQYAYPETRTLTACRRGVIVGVWVVPISVDRTGVHARRFGRVLPYSAPMLLDRHPQKRRNVMVALLDTIRSGCVSMALPMEPGFNEVAGCRELGMAVEWRHTNVLDLKDSWRKEYTATVRQHLRAVRRTVVVDQCEVAEFRFDLALVGQSAAQVALRERFAQWADTRGLIVCLKAMSPDQVGQLLIMRESSTAVLMHSWFDRTGPRGVPTVLIDAAAEMLMRMGFGRLDLEGSVIPTVDYFMRGFGGAAVPYPYVYWHRDVAALSDILMAGVRAGTELRRSSVASRVRL
jgi:hypothetical protein